MPSVLAFASVITPWDVEMIAIPKPLRTLGSFSALALTRKPGLEIFLQPLITLVPSAAYLREIVNSFLTSPLTL